MADVKYTVSVDSSGAVTEIKKLDEAWDKAGATQGGTAEKSGILGGAFGKLAGSMTIANLAADAIKKTFSALKSQFDDVIKSAMESEQADKNLSTALEMTGRTVAGNMKHYQDFAAAQMKVTKYDDEQIKSSQALLLTMTRLNQDGIDRATKGALGLATTFGMDLQSATSLVQKAVEGNTGALGRYGIKIAENLSPQEKTEAILTKLGSLYGRATGEVDTFGGSIAQLKNIFGEVYEKIGGVVTNNVALRDGIKNLSEKIMTFVESDRFKIWLSAISDALTLVIKGAEKFIGAIEKIDEAIFGSKAWEKFVADQTDANGIIQKGISIQELRRKAIDSEIITVQEWGRAYKESGGTAKAMMDSIASGGQGPAMKALFDDLLKVSEEQKRAADKAKEAIVQVGNQTVEAVKMSDFALKQIQDRAARMAEDQRQWRMFTGINLEPVKKIGETYDTLGKIVGGVMGSIIDGTADAKDATLDLTLAQSKLNKVWEAPSIRELKNELKDLTAEFDRMTRSGGYTEKELQRIRQRIKELETELKDSPKWVKGLKDAFTSMTPYVEAVFNGLNSIFSQAQQNREISIENEYKKRLAYIEKTITDEEKKGKAITALEAEFEIKRTSAKAAAAKQQKAVAIAEAIWNTARAVTEVLPNFILAGIVAAFGALQIATIAKQPIPLAKGAVFTKPTTLTTNNGQTYEMGEAGPEYLIPEKHLSNLLTGRRPGMIPAWAGAGAGGSGRGSFTININSPLVASQGLSQADLEKAGSMMMAVIERQMRRRGGR